MQQVINALFGFLKPYDFFAFLIPGLVTLIALSLLLHDMGPGTFETLVEDALPDNPWLQGGTGILIAYILGLVISSVGRWFAKIFYPRDVETDFNDCRDHVLDQLCCLQDKDCFRRISYGEAWVILRDAKNKDSYTYCYYLWGLEAMFRGLSAAFILLAGVTVFYDLVPGPYDNVAVPGVLGALALVLMDKSKNYYFNMLGEVARSMINKFVSGGPKLPKNVSLKQSD
jgi:hypothetical protein